MQHAVNVLEEELVHDAVSYRISVKRQRTVEHAPISTGEKEKLYYISGWLVSETIMDELMNKNKKKKNQRVVDAADAMHYTSNKAWQRPLASSGIVAPQEIRDVCRFLQVSTAPALVASVQSTWLNCT